MIAQALVDELAPLRRVDARIDAHAPARRSMDPVRGRATPLAVLATRLLEPDDDVETVAAFCDGLARLGEAQLEHFPENIFFDLDYPAAFTLRRARASTRSSALLDESFSLMAELQRLYGVHTPIRFRYVHDFSYGFDWAKWVRREPSQDGAVGPFAMPFLRYMRQRAHELLDLIERDDAKYPTLRDTRPRNPFPFSREPDAEIALHRELARRDLIPVRAWEVAPTPVWDRPFAKLRVEVAGELGLLER